MSDFSGEYSKVVYGKLRARLGYCIFFKFRKGSNKVTERVAK